MLIVSVNVLVSQDRNFKKGNKMYNLYSYQEAADSYLKVFSSGYSSDELFEKLGNSYYYIGDYKEALKWYDKLYALTKDKMKRECVMKYSQSFKAMGYNKKAGEFYDIYLELLKKSKNLNKYNYIDYYKETVNLKKGRYLESETDVNSEFSEYGAFYKDSTFYFTSNRPGFKMNEKIDAWSDKPFFKMYSVSYDFENKSFGKSKLVEVGSDTNFHESSLVITKDGNTMYFTRSEDGNELNSLGDLKIYRSIKENDIWSNTEILSFNREGYSSAHPVLSSDEKTMYFASNMPGSLGDSDIFSVSIKDGVFNEPINMGNKINTEGRESFPFLTKEDELYFSSDGHIGLGGYDVYYVDLNDFDMQIFNIGEPINSANDDFSFYVNEKGLGFFTNNKEGDDNIYMFKEKEPMKEFLKANIDIYVKDYETRVLVDSTSVTISTMHGVLVETSDRIKGGEKYTSFLRKYKKYLIKVERKGFVTVDSLVTLDEKKDSNIYIMMKKNKSDFKLNMIGLSKMKVKVEEVLIRKSNDLSLSPEKEIVKPIAVVTDSLAVHSTEIKISPEVKPVVIVEKKVNYEFDNIYFNFNSYYIKNKYGKELDDISALLIKGDKKIEIIAYTDERGTSDYNMKLSVKRAKEVVELLISRGISEDNIIYKGKGEDMGITEDCKEDKECLEKKYRYNRRVEFLNYDKK